jgi:hypothetical protein
LQLLWALPLCGSFFNADIFLREVFFPTIRLSARTISFNCSGSSLAVLSLEPTNWFNLAVTVSPSFMRKLFQCWHFP